MAPGTEVGSERASGGSITLVDDAVRHVRLRGAIDKAAVREFRLRVRPASWPARVDLSEVTSLDAAGLELLVHLARKQKRTGGELEVVQPPAPLCRLMERSGLTRVSHWVAAGAAAARRPGPAGSAVASA
jgi:anti-anti-sigma factor